MSEKRNNVRSQRPTSSVNPQGLSEDVANQRPDSQLEQKAKKSNTKR